MTGEIPDNKSDLVFCLIQLHNRSSQTMLSLDKKISSLIYPGKVQQIHFKFPQVIGNAIQG
jgi:hypothetical protein